MVWMVIIKFRHRGRHHPTQCRQQTKWQRGLRWLSASNQKWKYQSTLLFSWLIKPDYSTLTWTDQTSLWYCFPNWSYLPTVLFPELIKPVYSIIYWNITIVSTVLFPELDKPVSNTYSSSEQTFLQCRFLKWLKLPTLLFPELNKPAYNTVSSTDQTCLQYCFLNWSNLSTVLFSSTDQTYVHSCLLKDHTCLTGLFAEFMKYVCSPNAWAF